jgi:myo-inositol-1(or 4)-monophosphatase
LYNTRFVTDQAQIPMQPMLNIALRAARMAGEQIARAAERLDLVRVENNSVTDFLNDTATKAEQTIAYTLQKAYPTHKVAGVYSGEHAHTGADTPEVEWNVVAIDSANNFLAGLPDYAICMSATQKGRVEHAIILNPITGEEFTASRGHGAQINGKRMRVSNQRELPQSIISTSYLNTPKERSYVGTFTSLQAQIFEAQGTLLNTGSPALNLANLAAGRVDGFVQINLGREVLEAGALLVQEAGGLLGDFKGGNTFRQSGDTVAANPKLFKALLQSMKGLAG